MAAKGHRRHALYLPPALVQVIGLLIVIGSAVFWAITGKQSALLIGAGMTMVSVGAVRGVRVAMEAAGKVARDDD